MPQDSKGVITTGTGQVVNLTDLTAVFTFFGKSFPIGKFDPSAYPQMKPADTSWQKLGQEIMDQLDDSKYWTEDEMQTIAMMSAEDFLLCIHSMNDYWKKFPSL
jgi:hypothetical protein